MAGLYELADRYVQRTAELDPVSATMRGIPGFDDRMTDYSPDGIAAREQHDRQTLSVMEAMPANGDRERIARDVMRERLKVGLQMHSIGEPFRNLRVLGSPMQQIRQCFDLMSTDTSQDWETIATRMTHIPEALASLQKTLSEGLGRGLKVARRQVLACAEQATVWSGGRTGTPGFFNRLISKHEPSVGNGVLRGRLEDGAQKASAAYAGMARYLREQYAPAAEPRDPAGEERYAINARGFLGKSIDLRETYAWGWEELHRIEDRMQAVAQKILPGQTLSAVIELLETDPKRTIEGEENLRNWLQELMDRTIAELDGKHFDIPDPVKRVEAMIAPPGGTAAMYYTRPSEDFKRPGRTWYPTLGKTRFPLWGEVSTAYHEGVPGHHLQLAQLMYLGKELSRFQRTSAFIPGNSEGWALYAERLMGELGYFENPDYELGMLRAHAFRATRVIIDIGMHLELTIPRESAFHPGEIWSPDLGLEFALLHGYEPQDFMRSELDRYLGWPGQAICYKVGERVWLGIREQARHQGNFDLKRWHTRALNLGPMGLEQLERELTAA
jgi:uncharacterized protein (DUF885 family)